MTSVVVTFDLFSALTDSRTGGSAVFGELATARGWPYSGTAMYDRWDTRSKRLQRTAGPGVTFHDLSRSALSLTYEELALPGGDVDDDLDRVEESVAEWPLWPDAGDGLRAVSAVAAVGILSNVDEALVRTTRAYALVDPELVLTSQALGAYKPAAAIYRAAQRRVAPRHLLHVAASARDTRGALEAGIDTVRLVRPGHTVDPDGPVPPWQIETVASLADALRHPAGPGG